MGLRPWFLILLLAAPSQAARPIDECIDALSEATPADIVVKRSATTYEVTEGRAGHAHFFLRPDHVMTYTIEIGPLTRINAEAEFQAAIAHFGKNNVSGIDASWWRNTAEGDRFEGAIREGKTIRAAIWKTEIGRRARALGFTELSIPRNTELYLRAWRPQATGHAPERMRVQFHRPD